MLCYSMCMSEQRDPIRSITYINGAQWVHVDPSASLPTLGEGTAWRLGRTAATPDDKIGEMA